MTKKHADSIVKSRLLFIEKKLGLTGLFDGEVYHLSFDCPKPLAKLFKEATRAIDTSICRELRNYMSSY